MTQQYPPGHAGYGYVHGYPVPAKPKGHWTIPVSAAAQGIVLGILALGLMSFGAWSSALFIVPLAGFYALFITVIGWIMLCVYAAAAIPATIMGSLRQRMTFIPSVIAWSIGSFEAFMLSAPGVENAQLIPAAHHLAFIVAVLVTIPAVLAVIGFALTPSSPPAVPVVYPMAVDPRTMPPGG